MEIYTKGRIYLTEGEKIYFYVGEQGKSSDREGNSNGGGGGSSFISGHARSIAIKEDGTPVVSILRYNWTTKVGTLIPIPDPDGGYYENGVGHTEDGHAKIQLLSVLSNNNFLNSITLDDGDIEIDYDPTVEEYILNLDETHTSLKIKAIAKGKDTKVVGGDETIKLPLGETIHEIEVTAENGDVKTYKIKVQKETESESRLARLEVLGYPFTFDPDIFEYNIQVSKSKKKLLESEITAIPKDPNATVNFMGDLEKFIGSYMKIKLEIDGYVYDELVIAVRGDLNGDGLVTAADNIQAKAYVLGKKQQNFLVVKIADINQDGLLTSPDIIRIKNYILGERGLNE